VVITLSAKHTIQNDAANWEHKCNETRPAGCETVQSDTLRNYSRFCLHFNLVKGKVIPLQALTGPEDSSRLRLPEFKTIDR
jgi:hypothetical protein